jgi:tRNA nucleotidyltransferase/poly(A) polymerase
MSPEQSAPRLWAYLAEAVGRLTKIQKNFKGRALLVGGAVRDFNLGGRVGPDIDIVVESDGGSEKLAKGLAQYWGSSSSDPHALGHGYPIWQLVVKLPEELSQSLGFQEVDIQIADTQSEMFPDPSTRQRVTRFGLLDEDCARRDFTVNML